MIFLSRTLLSAALLFSLAGPCLNAAPPDPLGHWEGSISGPAGDVQIEIDLFRGADGKLSGTASQPEQKLRGFRLSNVSADGESVTFEVISSGGGRFDGLLSADGKSLEGAFNGPFATVPFALRRTGEARIEAPPKNAAIGKEFEGEWAGTLSDGGGQMRVVLKISNQPDGSSTGKLVSVDEGGLEIPLAMEQSGRNLKLEVKMTGGSWNGVLNAAGTELAGTYTLPGGSLPLVFRRAQTPAR